MEVEKLVNAALLFGCGVGEVAGCLVCEVVELGETGTAGAALGVPGVELREYRGGWEGANLRPGNRGAGADS